MSRDNNFKVKRLQLATSTIIKKKVTAKLRRKSGTLTDSFFRGNCRVCFFAEP